MIGVFHFLRPWWLAALLSAGLILVTLVRRHDPVHRWRNIVAPHLLQHLLIQPAGRQRKTPLVLIGVVWCLSVVAIAGPTWRREPTPFSDDIAAVVIVLKVTPSMRIADVQPDRLARSVQKIHDLLAKRPNAKTALIAYSGTAHVVVPLTSDAEIINTFAEPLDPAIMPVDGDACVQALQMANKVLADSKQAGSILWITDGVSSGSAKALAGVADHSAKVRILTPVAAGTAAASINEAASTFHAEVVPVTADDVDVEQLARDAQFTDIADDASGEQWHESGYAMVPLIVLLTAAWFRPGVLGACVREREDR